MKRFIASAFAILLASMLMEAQNISYSVEAFYGKGNSVGTTWKGGASFVADYGLSPELSVGAGVGAEMINSLYGHAIINDKRGSSSIETIRDYYHSEVTMPLFLRLKYVLTDMNFLSEGRLSPFVAIDGGYMLNLYSKDASDQAKQDIPLANQFLKTAKGFFYTPQVGLDSDKFYISIGMNMHSFTYRYSTRIISTSQNPMDKEPNILEIADHKPNFAQSIVFKLGIKF